MAVLFVHSSAGGIALELELRHMSRASAHSCWIYIDHGQLLQINLYLVAPIEVSG